MREKKEKKITMKEVRKKDGRFKEVKKERKV